MNFSQYTTVLSEAEVIALANGIGVTITRNLSGYKITPHKTNTHRFAKLAWADADVAIGQKCAWFPQSEDQTEGWNTPSASILQQAATVTDAPKDSKQEAIAASKANAQATLNHE